MATDSRKILYYRQRRQFIDGKWISPDCPSDKHGTPSGYNYYSCRCGICTVNNTQRLYRRRQKAKKRDLPKGVRHGKASTYKNYNCHCIECTKANRSAIREYRSKTRIKPFEN